MRPHIDASWNSRREDERAEVIEEHERADAPARCERKDASDGESAQIAAARFDDESDHFQESGTRGQESDAPAFTMARRVTRSGDRSQVTGIRCGCVSRGSVHMLACG